MKRCPSCDRVYSDAVLLCPMCGIELIECSSSCETNSINNGQEYSKVELHTQKTSKFDEKREKREKSGLTGWKILSGILLLAVLLFAGLYVSKISEIDELTMRYNQKDEEYAEQENLTEEYDLNGQYAINVIAVYNGTEEFERLSGSQSGDLVSVLNPIYKTLSIESLDHICFEWEIQDVTKSWGDLLYVDVIAPDGEVFLPENNHTWQYDLSDTAEDKQSHRNSFKDQWTPGTYRIVFYQGSRAIDSFEVKVS